MNQEVRGINSSDFVFAYMMDFCKQWLFLNQLYACAEALTTNDKDLTSKGLPTSWIFVSSGYLIISLLSTIMYFFKFKISI